MTAHSERVVVAVVSTVQHKNSQAREHSESSLALAVQERREQVPTEQVADSLTLHQTVVQKATAELVALAVQELRLTAQTAEVQAPLAVQVHSTTSLELAFSVLVVAVVLVAVLVVLVAVVTVQVLVVRAETQQRILVAAVAAAMMV
jgi:hypothetical protein